MKLYKTKQGIMTEAELQQAALHQLKSLGKVTVSNAALLWGVHKHTVRFYVKSGHIKALVFGTKYWILDKEVQEINAIIQIRHEEGFRKGQALFSKCMQQTLLERDA